MKTYPWKFARIFGQRLMQDLKDKSFLTLRLWADHCEYIVAQRIRRGQQIITFYDRIWGEKAFKDLIKGLRRQLQRHIKGIMLSSVSIYAFDWKTNRIQDDVFRSYQNEIDFVRKLRKETLFCPTCHKRKLISEQIIGIDYCKCPPNKNTRSCKNNSHICEWKPYLEKKGMVIWRKEIKSSLYAYKVHVKYSDITANDFSQVQTDIEYRKKWDDTAIALEIVDVDPEDAEQSQIVYWEMRWPKLFANRDYVYIRRNFIDVQNKLIILCNKSTEHPKYPINPKKQRVKEYWSYMVIKPFTTFEKPGLEFVLTYFDDPGLAIPSTVTSWVAQKQMPEFLCKLYIATKQYAEYKKKLKKTSLLNSWNTFKTTSSKESEMDDEVNYKNKMNKDKNEENIKTQYQEENIVDDDDTESIKPDQQENKSWWMYLRSHHYFV